MKLILNCDDLGQNLTVNDAIFGLMDKGRVTSATLLMGAPAIEDAVRRIDDYRHCSFGVHLNATEFCPLSSHPGLQAILNEEGSFDGNLRKKKITSSMADGVFFEWCTQIERALDMGVPVSHIDSHHHVHTEPALFRVLKRIQKKFGIGKIRITRNVYSVGEAVPWKKRASKSAWNFALRHYVATTTTRGFLSFSQFHQWMQAGMNWKGTFELMCHPGGPHFADETALLHGDWQEQLRRNTRLISFNDL
jgi:predicted glycoside hydrolase/deacetylase ChbG (UPF0249 family)